MPYVDRNVEGQIIGIYENQQREGQEWVEVATLYVAPLPLQDRIDAFIRQTSGNRINNELQLEGLTAGLLGAHLASGYTEPQLEAANSAYRQAKQLRAAVAAMRAQG